MTSEPVVVAPQPVVGEVTVRPLLGDLDVGGGHGPEARSPIVADQSSA